jgi:uncharacterized membrane protein
MYMIIEYVIALIASLVLDGIWLGVISKSLYKKYIGDLMLQTPHVVPALIFYLIFSLASVVFIINPAVTGQWGLGKVIGYGALLGLVIYGAYDLTNLAILKNWPLTISLIDIAWGVTFSAVGALVTVVLSRLIIK